MVLIQKIGVQMCDISKEQIESRITELLNKKEKRTAEEQKELLELESWLDDLEAEENLSI